jgi:flavin-binding protein dodecin
MSVARVIEISSMSTVSFQDALEQGIMRASQTLRNVSSAWIKEQRVDVQDGKITSYQVNMLVTFVLDNSEPGQVP